MKFSGVLSKELFCRRDHAIRHLGAVGAHVNLDGEVAFTHDIHSYCCVNHDQDKGNCVDVVCKSSLVISKPIVPPVVFGAVSEANVADILLIAGGTFMAAGGDVSPTTPASLEVPIPLGKASTCRQRPLGHHAQVVLADPIACVPSVFRQDLLLVK